jgi:hypothetical protein
MGVVELTIPEFMLMRFTSAAGYWRIFKSKFINTLLNDHISNKTFCYRSKTFSAEGRLISD